MIWWIYFTKPLQGELFRKLKTVLIGKLDIATFKEKRVAKDVLKKLIERKKYDACFFGHTNREGESAISR